MLNRFATLAAVCMLVPVGMAPLAAADPDPNAPAVPVADAGPPPGGPTGPGPSAPPGAPDPNAPAGPGAGAGPPPGGPNGPVPSAPPGVLKTPDGWVLTVQGSDESMEPVAPLTGSPASRS